MWSGGSEQEVDELLAVFFQNIVALVFVVIRQVVADFLQELHHTLLKEFFFSITYIFQQHT